MLTHRTINTMLDSQATEGTYGVDRTLVLDHEQLRRRDLYRKRSLPNRHSICVGNYESRLYDEKDVKVRIPDGQSSRKLWMFYHSLPYLAHGDAVCLGRNGKKFTLWVDNSFDLLVI
jgi:hypothetical protein